MVDTSLVDTQERWKTGSICS